MKKTTKRALVMSILSLLLCCSMLVGTTFAWFTDSVTSGKNQIIAGNLDIELEYWNGTEWKTVEGATEVLTNTLWEPGVTEVAYLRIANAGTLALKYQLGINILSEVEGKNQKGDTFLLSDYIQFGVVENVNGQSGAYTKDAAGRAKAIDEAKNAQKISAGYTKANTLYPVNNIPADVEGATSAEYFALVVYMPTTVGNDANHNGINVPEIDLGIGVLATQKDFEEDSFNSDYDKYSVTVKTTDELLDRLENAEAGEKIYMESGEYVLTETIVIPSGVSLYGAQAGNAAKNWANDPNAEKTVIKSTGSTNVLEILQSSGDPDEATANITIDGIMIDCDQKNVKAIYAKKSDGEAMEGIRIVNCAVVNSSNDGIDVCNAYGAVIENNYIANVKYTAIHLGKFIGYHYETWYEVTAYIRNNVIENVTSTTNGAIQIENGMGDVVVSGNVIKNVTAGSTAVKASAIHVYDVYEGGEILIENNTIEGADQGIAIYKYTYNTVMNKDWWEGPTTDNDIVAISNNTISGFTVFGIATSQLNVKNNTTNSTLVVIDGNTMTSSVSSKALFLDGTGVVTTTGNTLNGTLLP